MENQTKQNKINRVLRSLYRFFLLKEDTYPSFVINLEKEILKSALSDLNEIQIKEVANSWPNYYWQQMKADEQNKFIDQEKFKNHIDNLH